MKKKSLITYLLWALVAFAFTRVAKVSLDHFNGIACPSMFSIPVCYIITSAYGLMLGSLVINRGRYKNHCFCIGWAIAFAFAVFASLAEIIGGGGICPSSSSGSLPGARIGIPLCYISLAVLFVIVGLFIKGPYQSGSEDNE